MNDMLKAVSPLKSFSWDVIRGNVVKSEALWRCNKRGLINTLRSRTRTYFVF